MGSIIEESDDEGAGPFQVLGLCGKTLGCSSGSVSSKTMWYSACNCIAWPPAKEGCRRSGWPFLRSYEHLLKMKSVD